MTSGPDINLASLAPRTVTLAGAADFAGFRVACRELWATQVEPAQIDWLTGSAADGDLFANAGRKASYDAHDSELQSLRIPPRFMPILESAALHRDPQRFALLYRIVWRLQTEPGLRDDAVDPDTVRARQMAQAVRRDKHKMKAFVRFRTVEDDAREGPPPPIAADAEIPVDFDFDSTPGALDPAVADADADADAEASEVSVAPEEPDPRLHVAWFKPDHHIVEAVAPFFARRFANMRWAILTPDRSVEWDGDALLFGPGARRDQAPPADAGEALWLTYYQNIFNPARLRLSLMKREMPVRYWKNLPEARLIGGLAAQANERSMNIVDREPGEPSKRRPVRPTPSAAPASPAAAAAAAAEGGDASPEPAFEGDAPTSLPSLAASLERCRQCPIGELATQAVPGEGIRKARLMFVGEQPGDVEDLRGRPFVGPAGQLFDRALVQLGIARKDTWVTNAVKHFKFELRGRRRIHKTPAQQEAAACRHWLETEIDLVDPDAIVALGATAARQLMGVHVAVTRQRGQWLRRSDGRRVLVTLHPSALLRMEPEEKEAAWTAWLADLQRAADHLLRRDSRST